MVEASKHSAVSARGLVRRFGDVVAVDGIDLSVERGICLGVLGPNGAGKTTTIEMMVGLGTPDSGTIEILGKSWAKDAQAIRESIGVQLQETILQEKLTVRETLRLFSSFYREPKSLAEIIDLVGLGEKINARVGTLSGGQKQRLSLGCSLINEPEVLFLDEPSTGLDPQARRRVWEVVEQVKAQGGTVILTTHYMEEAEKLSDRLVVMDHGTIIAEGTPESLVASLGADAVVEFRLAEGVEQAQDLAAGLAAPEEMRVLGGMLSLTVTDVTATLTALIERSKAKGLTLEDLSTHRATLEDVFVSLTGRQLRDG